jgi:hypothetical protein
LFGLVKVFCCALLFWKGLAVELCHSKRCASVRRSVQAGHVAALQADCTVLTLATTDSMCGHTYARHEMFPVVFKFNSLLFGILLPAIAINYTAIHSTPQFSVLELYHHPAVQGQWADLADDGL